MTNTVKSKKITSAFVNQLLPGKLHVKELTNGQIFIVATPSNINNTYTEAFDIYTRIAEVLSQTDFKIVHERIFGQLDAEPEIMNARITALKQKAFSYDGVVTYIEGLPPGGSDLAGVIIRAIKCNKSNNLVLTVTDCDEPCGRIWTCNDVEFIVLQNVQGLTTFCNDDNSRPAQAKRMIERADNILKQQGFSYNDVVRTWFYLSGILDWYGQFNEVRNHLYSEFGLMPNSNGGSLLPPASTGIGADNLQASAGTMDIIAIHRAERSEILVKQLTNHAQADAYSYGAAFSRGALIRQAGMSLIELSGTAAIDEKGRNLYPSNVGSQIKCTFDKIEALISREGAGLKDICAATVFIKRPEFASVFWEIAAARGLEDFPCVCVVADVCRDGLLFEIDAEVVF